MIVQTILGHKVAAIGAALVLGTTTAAAAATGNVPFVQDDDPAVEVEATDGEEAEENPAETEDDAGIEEVAADGDSAAEEPDSAGDESLDEDGASGDDDAGEKEEVLPPVNDEREPYGDVGCEDAENHGEYVSGVAHDDSIEGNRGEIVSQAARTSCGKKDGGTTDATEQRAEEDEDAEVEDRDEDDADEDETDHDDDDRDDDDEAERADRGNGNGKGNSDKGNGRGRGNDKKDD